MKFRISRTSVYDDNIPPCQEAFQSTYIYTDTRTVDHPSKLKYGSQQWYDVGFNHRIEEGFIKNWYIEFNSLDELITLSKTQGSLIFNTASIEIYDDYRK